MGQSNIQKLYPLTPLQEGILYHAELDSDSLAYVIQLNLHLTGQLDAVLLEKSLQHIMDTHDVLRTAFVHQGLSRPRQIVLATRKADLFVGDLRHLTSEEQQRHIRAYMENDKKRGFHLERDVLIRLAVFFLADQSYQLIWSNHHIVLDGWSQGILMQRLFASYEALRFGQPFPSFSQRAFGDYVKWVKQQDQTEAVAFWKNRLSSFEHASTLLDRKLAPPTTADYKHAEYTSEWEETLTEALLLVAKRYQATPSALLHTMWGIQLGRYNNHDDVAFGTVVSGRPSTIPGIASMVGLFINTIPVRIQMHEKQTFSQLLQWVNKQALEAKEYEYLPLYEIQKLTAVQKGLVQHLIAFENYPFDQKLESEEWEDRLGFTAKVVNAFEQTNFDFTLSVFPGKSWTLKAMYNAHKFDQLDIQHMLAHVKQIARCIVKQPEILLEDINLLTPDETHTLLEEFTNTTVDYPDRTLHALFEEQVERTPHQVALIMGKHKYTYTQLNQAANQLARLLRDKGVGNDTIVGIMSKRCCLQVIAILATLKAGGAYLPIDPALPNQRIQFMLEDCEAKVLLAQAEFLQSIAFTGERVDIEDQRIAEYDNADLLLPEQPRSLAYVIYTSGTAGQPKGVLIEHHSIADRLQWRREEYGFTQEDVVLQVLAYSFDAFVTSLFTPLLSGSANVLVSEDDYQNPLAICRLIEANQVTYLFSVPGLFSTIIEAITSTQASSLRMVTLGGEKVFPALLKRIQEKNTAIELINEYGPTENSVNTTILRRMSPDEITIGRPVANTKVYIMGKHGQLQPIGAIGELCIVGKGLAKGYVNRPEEMQARFITTPFTKGAVMYKTGDLVRWLANGTIEFKDRMDDQVKIRGYRVELGEIEQAIYSCEGVKEAVVSVWTDSSMQNVLSAYLLVKESFSLSHVKASLQKKIAPYMLPHTYTIMDQFPLMASGKVDRKALPIPSFQADQIQSTPQQNESMTELETEISKVWKEVLQVKHVGLDDYFHELGGHSLKAMMLTSSIHQKLGKEVPIRLLFENPTVRLLAAYVTKQNQENQIQPTKSNYAPILPAPEKSNYPVSSAQRRMYIVSQMEHESVAYNIPTALLLEGNVDTNHLISVIQQLVDRHETLRTSFHMVEGELVQRIHSKVEVTVDVIEEMEDSIDELLWKLVLPFDLERAPLFRATIIRLSAQQHLLFIDIHHLVTDGVSMELFVNDLVQLYQGIEVAKPLLHYKDVAVWQMQQEYQESMEASKEYWLGQFALDIPVLHLPTDYPRPALQSFAGDRCPFTLDSSYSKHLDRWCSDNHCTLFMLLLATLQIFLAKLTRQEDIVVGTPIAGRTHSDMGKIPGLFVNTLALRNQPRGELPFLEYMKEVKASSLQAFSHQNFPFEELVEKLPLERDTSRSPLFQVMLNVQDTKLSKLQLNGLSITPYPLRNPTAKFDMTLTAVKGEEGLQFYWEYCTDLYSPKTIQCYTKHFLQLLKSAVDNPELPIHELCWISPDDRDEMTYGKNIDVSMAFRAAPLHFQFEDQVKQTPHAPALFYERKMLTYQELNELANRVALELRKRGVERNEIIALLLDRSIEMIVGVLAVLKAGGAYLPLDPKWPTDRLRYMIQDSRASVILTEEKYFAQLPDNNQEKILDIKELIRLAKGTKNPERINQIEDLAYLIYTSGTTGKPKGVMIEHRQVSHLVAGLHEHIYAKHPQRLKVAMVAPLHFDASVQQIFAALLQGHTLYVVPQEGSADPFELVRFYQENAIEITDGTPAHLQMIAQVDNVNTLSLRHLIIGGEALSYSVVREWFGRFNQQEQVPLLTNVYGPTECCVDVCYHHVQKETATIEKRVYVPIGRALGENQLLVVDERGRVQPVGIPGELCISGPSVGRGYWASPELTAERFIANPNEPKQVRYRTGDLARVLPDGEIEFLGRMDRQVKCRGYRIELGEIEAIIYKYPKIKSTVAVAYPDHGVVEDIYAYFTADQSVSVDNIREFLQTELPSYMIPSFFVQIPFIPLTSNGKVNRRALPTPQSKADPGEYVAPQTKWEKLLAGMWQEVLGVARVGRRDQFFRLGGHSLRAMTFVSSLQKETKRTLPLRVLFERPILQDLARYIEQQEKSEIDTYLPIEVADDREYYPLSSAQKRMYILQQLDLHNMSYHLPQALMLHGDFDHRRLEQAFQMLIDRHMILRTAFLEQQGTPAQVIYKQVHFQLPLTEGSTESVEEHIRQFIRPFHLQEAPLFRAKAIRLQKDHHLLLLDMHHIITDGVSTALIVKELAQFYAGVDVELPRLQYKDYAVWQADSLHQEWMRRQERYWLQQLGEAPHILELPADDKRPFVQSFAGDLLLFQTTKEITRGIRQVTGDTKTTLFMFLLACFHVLLHKLTRQEDLLVGTAVAGRTHGDTKDMLGMFVNTVVLRSRPTSEKTFAQFLQEIKETSLTAFENQDYPFEELISKLHLERDMSNSLLVNVMMTLANMELPTLNVDDLTITPYTIEHQTTKFDLTLAVVEQPECLMLQFEYSTVLFKRDTIKRWSRYLLTIIQQVIHHPDVSIGEIGLVGEEERKRLLEEWNQTTADLPANKTVKELFEEQVLLTPDGIAVRYEESEWTYRQLNAHANRLASVLIQKGIKPNQQVGIMVKPSLQMAQGVLAIVKTGAAFLPLDPKYPSERISYMLEDSEASCLLIQAGLQVPERYHGEVIWIEDYVRDCPEEPFDAANPKGKASVNDLAYVIYTSGTTGLSKGVMIEQHSLVNLCYWHNHTFKVTQKDRSAKFSGFSFDASVWEMFPYWLAGATVCMVKEEIRHDLMLLHRFFEQEKITISFLPTQLCEQFIELPAHSLSLRILLTGGEKLRRALSTPYTVVNNYGPTEATVVATSTVINTNTDPITIGRPVYNTRVYILDEMNQLAPIGVTGELCIAGKGIARGYINRPAETAERFGTDPFYPNERMYRTGDQAKWIENGLIDYVGRIDQQVKIRGHRIELAEIESQLLEHPMVKSAAVLDRNDAKGALVLCAYIVPVDRMEPMKLRADLLRVLPEFMIPTYWQEISQIPLNHNGKIDRSSLPAINVPTQTERYQAPRDEKERLLVEVWQEVLGMEQIGITDHFFWLGGDSIKAIQMSSRLYKQGWKLEMKELFRSPTIEQVASHLQWIKGTQADQGSVEGEAVLTPIQRWFFEQQFTNQHHWNQSMMIHSSHGFHEKIISQSFQHLVRHHDALRMVYEISTELIRPYNAGTNHEAFQIVEIDVRHHQHPAQAIEEHANKMQECIQLQSGPLVKLALYHAPDGDHLLIIIHHLVIDGVSWRILLDDFAHTYAQLEQGQVPLLPEKTNSFMEWSLKLKEYAHTEDFLQQLPYWSHVESLEITPLPRDRVIQKRRQKDLVSYSFELSTEDTIKLTTKVHQAYLTEINDILLTALTLSLRFWTKSSQVGVLLEGHGREEILPNLSISRTVGWFTTQYPVVFQMDEEDTSASIRSVKEQLRQIPNKGIGYGMLRYLTKKELRKGLEFSLEPEIAFNYLGQFDNENSPLSIQTSSYSMGYQISPDSTSPYALMISGLIRKGQLIMTCSYHPYEFTEDTIMHWMNRFHSDLRSIIEHCVSQKETIRTPSDFSASDLEMEEVDNIFSLLEDKL
ncbi:hypothetical protein AYJ08_10555 [Brevibacillus sp. SKDU10]|uniref:non-ribosomal peptide synthetase n=1 Tax=Brevibacillus sp. SKDU10 TaxID=1247872 RepID=UPI0007C8EE2F|nr:non-ribosomal peptide synthetase [Brevibacillus sp. SKDU10]OAJ74062.1 hypothetical protein AYJ08_10555 [Brevibacillus sp. SKDU10]